MGDLYIIATPIGNLEDISLRALRILKEVDLILCEDTRVTKKLLSRHQIDTVTISYHQHSKITKAKFVLGKLKQGKNLALVSDAGTPTISDPGAKLISYLLKEISDLKIIPVPGPSAVIAALSISGLAADKFVFLGFPPIKKKRNKFFKEVAESKYTVVLYESPHRIIKTLKELGTVIADKKQIVVCKELTKKFEKVYRGDINKIIDQIKNSPAGEKGEFVIIVSIVS